MVASPAWRRSAICGAHVAYVLLSGGPAGAGERRLGSAAARACFDVVGGAGFVAVLFSGSGRAQDVECLAIHEGRAQDAYFGRGWGMAMKNGIRLMLVMSVLAAGGHAGMARADDDYGCRIVICLGNPSSN